MLQEVDQIKNTVVLIFQNVQYFHLMSSGVAWVLISSGTQVHSQVILDPDCLPFRVTMIQFNCSFNTETKINSFNIV